LFDRNYEVTPLFSVYNDLNHKYLLGR
jgi:hypothetical protein